MQRFSILIRRSAGGDDGLLLDAVHVQALDLAADRPDEVLEFRGSFMNRSGFERATTNEDGTP